MRVVLLSKALVVGTYQTKAEAIAAEGDIDLIVVVPPYWREGKNRLSLEQCHTRGYDLRVAPLFFNGAYHLHFYPTLPRLLNQLRPDLVHIDEEPYNLATWMALRAARAAGARTLCFAWQNLNRRYPLPFCWFERSAYQTLDGALAGNHAAAHVLRDKGYDGPLRVIPQFGVDPELFVPSIGRASSQGRSLTIGFAGRFVEEKGLLVLLEALARLDGPWRLALYGDGPLESSLRARLAELGLAQRAAFYPRVPSGEMPRILAELDVVVLPSLTRPHWKEQFGRVLIEAMACETPVIGSDSGEIPHVIGDAGLVVPEGDPEALAAALGRLRDEPGLGQRLGRLGRARVLSHFTQAQVAAETVAFYRELMA